MADEVTLPQPRVASEPVEAPASEPVEPPASEPVEAPAAEPAVAETATARGGRWRRRLVALGWTALVVVLVAVILAGGYFATGNRGTGSSLRARPGDCFSGDSDSDLKRVPCDDHAVRWSVIGVVEHKTQQESTQNACEAWPNAEASYWESRNGKDGFVLCLGSVTAG